MMSPAYVPVVDIPAITEEPLEFTTPKGEFVDRQEIIDDLYDLALLGLKPFSSNMAIIGPRRIGKSAIIERVFNHMYTSQRDVIPLYFSFRTYEGKSALDTLTLMGRTFVTQYFHYQAGSRMPKALYSMAQGEKIAEERGDEGAITALARYFRAMEADSELEILEKLADLPRTIAATNDSAIAVFLDEFQVIMQLLDRRERTTDLRATFKDSIESPRCNFFISGSAVTIMREQIIGRGPLFGRFTPMYIPPLEQYWGLELVRKLAGILDIEIGEELVAYLVEYTNAQPYYIHCFMKQLHRVLRRTGVDRATRDLISLAISNEETAGELSNFFDQLLWDFIQHYKPIAWPVLGFIASYDTDHPIDHEALYGFLEGIKSDVPWLAKYAELETAMEMLTDLAKADVLQTNGPGRSMIGPYRFGSDPVLKRYAQLMYEHEFEGRSLDMVAQAEYQRLLGLTRDYKRQLGYLLESHVKYLMLRWDGRTLEGALFGADDAFGVPTFNDVHDTVVKAAGDRMFQIDAFGYFNDDAVGGVIGWAVECRYRSRKAARKDIEKFAAALDALKKERTLAAIQGWFLSIEGFTTDALEALDEYGIYYSGREELNALLKAFGLRTIGFDS